MAAVVLGLLVGPLVACRIRRDVSEGRPAPSASAVSSVRTVISASAVPAASGPTPTLPDEIDVPLGAAVVAFGGADSTPDQSEALVTAARLATARLVEGGSSLEAVVAGVVVLEDEPSLDAGTGASLRFDGTTIECDAAVMDDQGRFAAVGALQQTRNPVRVALALLDGPHRILVGQGAAAFARSRGFDSVELSTPAAVARYAARIAALRADGATPAPSASASGAAVASPPPVDPMLEFWRRRLADATSAAMPSASSPPSAAPPPSTRPPSLPPGTDTVAVLVRSADGRFAGGVSSGGSELSLPGRVGDVVVPGAALWVAEDAAIAVSGRGEDVIDHRLAARVYERLRVIRSARLAAQWGLDELGGEGAVVVLNRQGAHVAAGRPIAWAENGASGERSSAPPVPSASVATALASAAAPAASAPTIVRSAVPVAEAPPPRPPRVPEAPAPPVTAAGATSAPRSVPSGSAAPSGPGRAP